MADLYKIGIEILLAGSWANQLQIMGAKFAGINATVREIEQNIGRWGLAIAGVGSIVGGSMLLKGFGDILKAGEEVEHQIELMKTAGDAFGGSLATANKMAQQVSQTIQTSTWAENLKSIREMTGAFGDESNAEKYLEIVRKSQAILDTITGNKGASDQIWQLVKSGELKGYTMPGKEAEFKEFIDNVTKSLEVFGGKVTAADIFQAFKYGRTAMYGWDKTFISEYLPTLIQEMKSSGGSGGISGGPGNPLMSAYQAIVNNQIAKNIKPEWEKMGLLDEGGKVRGPEIYQRNPYAWVQEILMPALKAAGITGDEETRREIGDLFRLRTAGSIMTLMATQQARMEKDAALVRQAPGLGAFDELARHDPTMVMQEFTSQWTNLMEALGQPIVKDVINVMKGITDGITAMSAAAQAHPAAVKAAMELLAGVAIGAIFAGIVAIVAAIAPFIGAGAAITGASLAIVALSAAITGLVSANWDGLIAKVKGLTGAIGDFFSGTPHPLAPGTPGAAPQTTTPPAGGTPGLAPENPTEMPFSKKQSYNAVPPSPGGGADTGGSVYLDGRKVADILMDRMFNRGLPTEGSPYHDSTWSAPAQDTALSMG